MRVVFAMFGVALLVSGTMAACDTSVRVGELKEPPFDGGPLGPDPDGGVPVKSWKLHAPTVPCSIYALVEARADDIWVGCNGGRIYRYDGVRAKLSYFTEAETEYFSLLHVTSEGKVWAAAQSTYDGDKATSTLYHFDGTAWVTFDSPRPKERITSIAGAGKDVWLTTRTEIFRLRNDRFAFEHTAPKGDFRACSFSAKSGKGYCVGTEGLALTWDGTAWTPLAGAPWSPQAEVFGVEYDLFDERAAFFFGEPYDGTDGDHACKLTRLSASGTTFTTLNASLPQFADFDIARKRTGRVIVGGATYLLISPEATYGGGLVFDPVKDTVRPLCGPVTAFAQGLANTRVGGHDGLLGTFTGSGGDQIAVTQAGGSNIDFDELSVAPDGTAWTRARDSTACGSVSAHLRRFEENEWTPVPGPQQALSGRGLAAVARDHAYTLEIADERLLEHRAGTWVDGPTFPEPWTLSAKRAGDVWLGGYSENFGHYDGTSIRVEKAPDRRRQITQIIEVDGEVWMVQLGTTSGDTDRRIVRYAGGVFTDWSMGLQDVRLSAIDKDHVFRSGDNAAMWDGEKWKPLGFEASGVFARANDEVYFTSRGDIWLWNGAKRERVYHGFVAIYAIDGVRAGPNAPERAFAVGHGGLTIELGRFPTTER